MTIFKQAFALWYKASLCPKFSYGSEDRKMMSLWDQMTECERDTLNQYHITLLKNRFNGYRICA